MPLCPRACLHGRKILNYVVLDAGTHEHRSAISGRADMLVRMDSLVIRKTFCLPFGSLHPQALNIGCEYTCVAVIAVARGLSEHAWLAGTGAQSNPEVQLRMSPCTQAQ